MPSCQVTPVLFSFVDKGSPCLWPYPGHRHGCPNFGRKNGCPPGPKIGEMLDLSRPVYAIWTTFDLAAHRRRMAYHHPNWTLRQLNCCLYWQSSARKNLRAEIRRFLGVASGPLRVIPCPEGAGVNLTATMASIGEHLQWPPDTTTYQIVLAGASVR
jgi:hypothetical protein